MSNQLFSGAPAPASATPALPPPQQLLNALNTLAGAGWNGILDDNGAVTYEAKASFYLSKVEGVTVVAPAARASSSQLALAAAAVGMAGVQGAVIAYNTSFAKLSATKAAGIIPGVYGVVLLCGDAEAVKTLVGRIEADREQATAGARRVGGGALPSALPSAPASAPDTSDEL